MNIEEKTIIEEEEGKTIEEELFTISLSVAV